MPSPASKTTYEHGGCTPNYYLPLHHKGDGFAMIVAVQSLQLQQVLLSTCRSCKDCTAKKAFLAGYEHTGMVAFLFRTSTNGHLSIAATSPQRPGFFVPIVQVRLSMLFTLIETSLQRPSL